MAHLQLHHVPSVRTLPSSLVLYDFKNASGIGRDGHKTGRLLVDPTHTPGFVSGSIDSSSVLEGEGVKTEDGYKSPGSAALRCGSPLFTEPEKQEGVDYWERVLAPVQKKDKAQCDTWKDEVQNILIFAGLFSAVVTAFLVETYKNLQPDPNETAVLLLARIVAHLENQSNAPASPPDSVIGPSEAPFTPSNSAIRVNAFWFLSLVLSLTTVLIGITSLQWIREHQSYPEYFSPQQTFTLLHMRTQMLQKWRVSAFFSSLPLLLALGLIFFLIGLADFLVSLGIMTVTIPMVFLISLSLGFLLLTTAVPSLHTWMLIWKEAHRGGTLKPPVPCPYKSPQSRLFRTCFATLHYYLAVLPSSMFNADEHSVKWLPYARLDMLMDASDWINIDFQWMLIRWCYSAYVLSGPTDSLPDARSWDNASGPRFVYEGVEGLRQVCDDYHFDSSIHDAAYNCLSQTISLNISESSSAAAPIQLKYHESLLKSLVELLKRQRGSRRGKLTLPLSKLADIPTDVEFLLDVLLLEFVGFFKREMTLELHIRSINFLQDYATDETLAHWRQCLYWRTTVSEDKAVERLEDKYVETLFNELIELEISWTVHFAFQPQRLAKAVKRYVEMQPKIPPLRLLRAATRLRFWIEEYFLSDVGEDATPEQMQAIQSLLVADAIIIAYKGYARSDIPDEIFQLGLVLDSLCETILFHPERPHGKMALQVLETTFGRGILEWLIRPDVLQKIQGTDNAPSPVVHFSSGKEKEEI
ncbi:unnamed protein product [Cyclocybe aegerita]|uniref:DUF6535 domain-containing protein n=1 Tax=Cyclocybe aegerita TaxID=1973307 RepID=A0A8S0XQL7_CYCAE|nr:unnamed protein product [Cyclocybe aegerita]